MPPSFDLAEQGFCRVRWRDDHEPTNPDAPLSFRELLRYSPDIADIQPPNPPALAALLRILYVLTGRISGLDTFEEHEDWEDARDAVWERGAFDLDAVDRYFDKYSGRFELFHTATNTPFLQDKRLLEQCRTARGEPTSSGVNKLMLGRAAGQGFVWQSHTVDAAPRPAPASDAFFALLTWLYFGVPGRCTPRQVGETNAADTKAGPLRGTVSFHPAGNNLFETLVLGVPFLPNIEDSPAAWEDTERDPCGVPPSGGGLGNALAGRFRHALLLEPDEAGEAVTDARITWAWRTPHGPVQDPYLIYRAGKEAGTPPYPEVAQTDRAVWRDLDALLGKQEDQRYRPSIFSGLDDLVSEQGRTIRIKALGFDQDRSQAKDRQYFSGATPAKAELWQHAHPERWERIRMAREAAEERGAHLRGALTSAWHDLTGETRGRARDGGVRWLHTGMARYWETAEHLFWEAVRTEQPPATSVVNAFIHQALAVFDEVTRGEAKKPHGMKILERHRRRLWTGFEPEQPAEKAGNGMGDD